MDIEKVYSRLESLGYKKSEGDEMTIPFVMEKVENTIKSSCNTSTVPMELLIIAIDMVCGEFLYTKKQSKQLEGFDCETAVTKVKLGDTDITFDKTLSVDQRLDNLIHYLMVHGKEQFACYRKIKW